MLILNHLEMLSQTAMILPPTQTWLATVDFTSELHGLESAKDSAKDVVSAARLVLFLLQKQLHTLAPQDIIM